MMKLISYMMLLSLVLPSTSLFGHPVGNLQDSKASSGPSSGPAVYRPVVGEVHTDFKLPNIQNGDVTSLSDFRGKKVLLVHFASW